MKIADLYAEISARATGFYATMGRVKAMLAQAHVQMQQASAAAAKLFLVGGAAAAGSIYAFVRWEAVMARVHALTQASADDFKKLEAESRRLGATTQFTSVQAAEAMAEFALKGFQVQQIIEAMTPTLDLAALGQIGMAQAAEIAAGVMQGMQLSTRDLAHVIDVLGKATITSSTDIPMLGAAMQKVGPIAYQTGVSIETIVAAIQILANNMIQGSDAGTAMRNIFLRLQSGVKEVEDSLKELGVSIVDDTGAFRPFADILDDVKKNLANFTAVDQQRIVVQLAGLRAAAAFNILLEEGGDKIRKMTKALEGAEGTGARIRDRLLEATQGKLTILMSAVEEFAITIGERLNPVLVKLIDIGGYVFNILNKLTKGSKDLIAQILLMGTGVAGLIFIISPMVTIVGALIQPMVVLVGLLALAGTNLLIASQQGATFGERVSALGDKIKETMEYLKGAWQEVLIRVLYVWAGIATVFANIGDYAKLAALKLILAVEMAVSKIHEAAQFIAMIMLTIFNNFKNLASAAFDFWAYLLGGFIESVKSFSLDPLKEHFAAAVKDMSNAVIDAGLDKIHIPEHEMSDVERRLRSSIDELSEQLGGQTSDLYKELLEKYGLLVNEMDKKTRGVAEGASKAMTEATKDATDMANTLGKTLQFQGLEQMAKSIQLAAVSKEDELLTVNKQQLTVQKMHLDEFRRRNPGQSPIEGPDLGAMTE